MLESNPSADPMPGNIPLKPWIYSRAFCFEGSFEGKNQRKKTNERRFSS